MGQTYCLLVLEMCPCNINAVLYECTVSITECGDYQQVCYNPLWFCSTVNFGNITNRTSIIMQDSNFKISSLLLKHLNLYAPSGQSERVTSPFIRVSLCTLSRFILCFVTALMS